MKLLLTCAVKAFAFTLLLFSTDDCWSQQQENTLKDSLLSVWNDTDQTPHARNSALYEYLSEIRGKKPDSVLLYAHQMYQLAGEHQDSFHIASATYLIADAEYDFGNYTESVQGFKKAIQLYRAVGDTARVGFSYAFLGNAYKPLGELELAAQS